jgi:hypothetical protein
MQGCSTGKGKLVAAVVTVLAGLFETLAISHFSPCLIPWNYG